MVKNQVVRSVSMFVFKLFKHLTFANVKCVRDYNATNRLSGAYL